MSSSSHPTRGNSSRGRSRGRGRGRGRGGLHRGRGGRPSRHSNPYDRTRDSGSEVHPRTHNERSTSPAGGHGSRGRRRHLPKPSANELQPTVSEQEDFPSGCNLHTTTIENKLVDMTELSAHLSALMTRGALECVICLDRIRRQSPLWNCQTCYTITHLNCARKWVSHSADENSANSDAPVNSSNLTCPKCREPIDRASLFNFCYCRRKKAPRTEPGVVPGSCGEPCRKSRGGPESSCRHKCNLLCHPGPCPPCLVLRPPQPCFCGKHTVVRTCGEPDGTTSCQIVCGKIRSCGHPCDRICHLGKCSECSVIVPVQCFCGRNKTSLPCGVKGYACESICNKPLGCGIHYCTASCHEGPCTPCKSSPQIWSTCACGKRPLSDLELRKRIKCTDPIPSCGQVCGQPLGCIGGHTCGKICGHADKCGKCDKTVQAECRCGVTVKSMICGENFDSLRAKLLCNKKCNDRLICRQHNCQTICCPFRKRKVKHGDIVRPNQLWPLAVLDSSSAGSERRRAGHKCTEICNKQLSCEKHNCDLTCGHAGPCPPCGLLIREPVTCACGMERIRPPVQCGTPAPPCQRKCSLERDCGHPCPDYCHFGPCPPCLEIVKRSCVGNHGESRFVHCHIGAKGIRCHRACGRPLQCGIHACLNPCHGNYPENCENSTSEGCSQICALPRKKCEHSCASKCHPEIMCPDVPCKELVPVTCPCGRRKEQAMCLRGGQSHGTNQENRIRLTCDDECAAQSRLRGFAVAVGKELLSDGTVVKSKIDDPDDCDVQYSDFLLRFAEHESTILAHFERELASIVMSRSRKIVMDDLPELHRYVLHMLSELYLLDSESSNRGKSRRITIRHRGAGTKPVFPKPLLSEALLRREQEKRRNRMENRNLAIHVLSGWNMSERSGMEAQVEHNLKEHAGFYRIVGRTILTSGLEGLLVEFSTMERASSALASLKLRSGVSVELAKQARSRGDISETARPQTVRATPAASRSWNDEDNHPNLNSGQIFALSRPVAPNTDDDANVPDSWDD